MNEIPVDEMDLDFGSASLEEEPRGLVLWVDGRHEGRDVAVGFEMTNLDPTGADFEEAEDGLIARSFYRPVLLHEVEDGRLTAVA